MQRLSSETFIRVYLLQTVVLLMFLLAPVVSSYASDTHANQAIEKARKAMSQNRFPEARAHLKKLVDSGNLEAIHETGNSYLDGGNIEEARKFYDRAAGHGFVRSISNLGYIALRHDRDANEAKKFFLKAIKKGSVFSIGGMASVYLKLEHNAPFGYYWTLCASIHGHKNAENVLSGLNSLLEKNVIAEATQMLKLRQETGAGERCPPTPQE